MLSLPHLIIVFVVALVVFGPEKLPELARNVGKFMAEFRRMTGDFRSTFESQMRELEREADERRRVPAAPPPATPPAIAPAENSIRGSSTEPPAEVPAEPPSVPVLTPAHGIVPSADPRNPAQDAAPHEKSNGGDGASAAAPAEESGDTPEPVTDGRNYTD